MSRMLESVSSAQKFGASIHSDFLLGLNKSLIYEAPIRLTKGCVCLSGMEIGAYSFAGKASVNPYAKIGRYCSIAKGVIIGAFPHPMSWLSSSSFQYDAKKFGFFDGKQEPRLRRTPKNDPSKRAGPTIGHDVWIGSNAIILNNVTIGSGSVIAAGAVVTKDVPPYAIVAGVPAKVINYRFEEEIRKELLSLEWWNWDIKDLSLPFDRPPAAIKKIRQLIGAGELERFSPPRFKITRDDTAFHVTQLTDVSSGEGFKL